MASPLNSSLDFTPLTSFENRPDVKSDYHRALPADLEQRTRLLETELGKVNLKTASMMTASGEEFSPKTFFLRVTPKEPDLGNLTKEKLNSILSKIYTENPSLNQQFEVSEVPIGQSFDIKPIWDT